MQTILALKFTLIGVCLTIFTCMGVHIAENKSSLVDVRVGSTDSKLKVISDYVQKKDKHTFKGTQLGELNSQPEPHDEQQESIQSSH